MAQYPIQSIPLDDIRTDGGTQSRAAINDAVVAAMADDIAESVAAGEANPLPPAVVFHDAEVDVYWLASGFHRELAHRRANLEEMLCEVRPGDINDAKDFSSGSNATPGITRQSNADKRCAVTMAISTPKGKKLSDREIAQKCGASRWLVAKLKADPLSGSSCQIDSNVREVTRGGTTYDMDVSNIQASNAGDEADAEDVEADLPPEPETPPPKYNTSNIVLPKIMNDSHGGPVPPELFPVFEAAKELRGVKGELGKLLARLEQLKAGPGGAKLSWPSIEKAMRDLQDAVTKGLPTAICPVCEAVDQEKCQTCGGRGWLCNAQEASLTNMQRKHMERYKRLAA